jgi:ATP synthase protein I
MAEDDDDRLRSDLDRLKSSLSKARQSRRDNAGPQTETSNPAQRDSGMSLGMRAGSEFITAVVLGAGIGWGLDRLIGTKPVFMIGLFFLGVVTGVWNVIRLTSPKGGVLAQDSRLSQSNAADKGLRRSAPAAEPDASRRLGTSRGAIEPSGGADDDEE